MLIARSDFAYVARARSLRMLFSVVCGAALAGCSKGSGGSLPLPAGVPDGAISSLVAAQRPNESFMLDPWTSAGFKSIYAFKGGMDGASPQANLVELNGVFYGTTVSGGGSDNDGTVFEVSKSGSERVLYSFKGGTDGASPEASLIAVDGKLYGTTRFGGDGPSGGNGTVFEVSTSGKERILHRFKGGLDDGAFPYANLIAVNGVLYGTTEEGGGPTGGGGTVYEVSTSGNESVIYHFKNQPDGAYPLAGLIALNGELYGTTAGGGTLNGTVFEVSTSGEENVLYTFKGRLDGETPAANLIALNGKLYGTTTYGGSVNPSISNGTVFEVSLSGRERILHRFQAGLDGASPLAGLIAVRGELYGTTYFGGTAAPSSHGNGIVFEVNKSGQESVLHRFQGGTEGGNPAAGLIAAGGALYGTTSDAGLSSASGDGTVFKISP